MESQEYQCRELHVLTRKTPHRISFPVKFVQKVLRRYKHWLAIKESCRQLQKMDERMLEDIGISRADLVTLTTDHGLFWQHMVGSSEPGPESGA